MCTYIIERNQEQVEAHAPPIQDSNSQNVNQELVVPSTTTTTPLTNEQVDHFYTSNDGHIIGDPSHDTKTHQDGRQVSMTCSTNKGIATGEAPKHKEKEEKQNSGHHFQLPPPPSIASDYDSTRQERGGLSIGTDYDSSRQEREAPSIASGYSNTRRERGVTSTGTDYGSSEQERGVPRRVMHRRTPRGQSRNDQPPQDGGSVNGRSNPTNFPVKEPGIKDDKKEEGEGEEDNDERNIEGMTLYAESQQPSCTMTETHSSNGNQFIAGNSQHSSTAGGNNLEQTYEVLKSKEKKDLFPPRRQSRLENELPNLQVHHEGKGTEQQQEQQQQGEEGDDIQEEWLTQAVQPNQNSITNSLFVLPPLPNYQPSQQEDQNDTIWLTQAIQANDNSPINSLLVLPHPHIHQSHTSSQISIDGEIVMPRLHNTPSHTSSWTSFENDDT